MEKLHQDGVSDEKYVLTAICEDLSRHFGSKFRICSTEKMPTPYTVVFKICCAAEEGNFDLYAKWLRAGKNSPSARSIFEEYQIMLELSKSTSPVLCQSVPRPVRHYPEFAALVTKGAPGVQLERFLSRAIRSIYSSRTGMAIELAHRVGTWLREFHECTKSDGAIYSHREIAAYCMHRLQIMINDGLSGIDREYPDVVRKLAERADASPLAAGIFVCGQHGDFAPHNILTDGVRISVIDFGGYKLGVNIHDVISFLEKVRRMQERVLSNKSAVMQINQGFMDGYGLNVQELASSDTQSLIQIKFKLIHILHAHSICRLGGVSGHVQKKRLSRLIPEFREFMSGHNFSGDGPAGDVMH